MVIGKLKKRIVCVEESDRLRDGLSFIIESNNDYVLVSAYQVGQDAIRNIKRDCPDLVITDIAFSDMNGIEFIRIIKNKYPLADIVVFTDILSSDVINEVLTMGVSGYILKNSSVAEFTHAIDVILNGGTVLSPLVAKKVVEFFCVNPFTPLSGRETEVLKLITHGKTYSQIAGELSISLETSKTHIRNIYKKLNVNSKSEAVRKAIQQKLIPVSID